MLIVYHSQLRIKITLSYALILLSLTNLNYSWLRIKKATTGLSIDHYNCAYSLSFRCQYFAFIFSSWVNEMSMPSIVYVVFSVVPFPFPWTLRPATLTCSTLVSWIAKLPALTPRDVIAAVAIATLKINLF